MCSAPRAVLMTRNTLAPGAVAASAAASCSFHGLRSSYPRRCARVIHAHSARRLRPISASSSARAGPSLIREPAGLFREPAGLLRERAISSA